MRFPMKFAQTQDSGSGWEAQVAATGGGGRGAARLRGDHRPAAPPGAKIAKLVQKLGQLQPVVAAFPPACVGQLAFSWPT
jgi:hypothetical protein